MTTTVSLQRSITLHVSVIGAIWISAMAGAQSTPRNTDRQRVKVATVADKLGGPALKVIRTDNNTPLRAGTAWIWSQQWKEEPPEYYAAMRGKGLNAVRIVLFDTWEHEAGYVKTNWNDPAYRTAMIGRIERAVNLCSQNGLYAIINSHNKIPQFDVPYNQALWTQLAGYFSKRTHVLFEIDNESLDGTKIGEGGVFTDTTSRLKDLRDTYDIIRERAPETHVMVLTPSGISGWGYVDAMARLTRRFEQLGSPIDWTKTSVAYHLYHADVNLFPEAQNLRNFHSQFPGWPSENNFPSTITNEQLGITDTWRAASFGKDTFLNQTCERLGVGWSHWNINRLEQLDRNWPILWADAVAKGYTWQPDPVVNGIAAINAGGNTARNFAADINYFGGETVSNNTSGPVDVSGVKNAAPADVYRSNRKGNFTYQVARLAVTKKYLVRLHFSEDDNEITEVGQRLFSVYANNIAVLKRFDIFAVAGKKLNRAVVQDVTATSDSKGRINVRFESGVQSAKVNGIEVLAIPAARSRGDR